MRYTTAISALALASWFATGCVVQMPGNLDAGESETGDGDGDAATMTMTTSGDGDPTGDGDGDPTGDGDGDGDPTGDGDGDGDPTGDGDGDGDPTGDGDGDGEPDPVLDGDGCQDAVDILVVVDNSGSMGTLQRRLALSMENLITPFEQAGVDWRLGVTTTDSGNPWCPPGVTQPASGNLLLRNCKDHLEDFIFAQQVNAQAEACTDICPLAPGGLSVVPTTTDGDPNPAPRPWVENIGGQSNLADDIDPIDAALCMIPQGINGCGFEQPLESMSRALKRSEQPDELQAGFMRANASLLIVLVSDEVDCSYDPDHVDIFLTDSQKTFWSDPDSAFPTSALCWNAGVACEGDPNGLDCDPANYNQDGTPAMPSEAVLISVDAYADQLAAIEDEKRALDPGADVGLLVISGLGLDDALSYVDVSDSDPQQHDSFGIGPGCVDGDTGVQAIPPVRMRDLARGTTSDPLGSICEGEYSSPLGGAVDRLIGACEG